MNQHLVELLQITFGYRSSFTRILSKSEWDILYSECQSQHIDGIVLSGIEKLPKEQAPYLDLLMEWVGQVHYQENQYKRYKVSIEKLASFYEKHAIKMMLFKGYGLSLNYPIPNRRPTGDIDVYLYGNGSFADNMIEKFYGISTKQNDDKHSLFEFDGFIVENHARFISDNRYPSLLKLESFLEKEAKTATSVEIDKISVYLPSVMSNALFLPYHTAEHFIYGESSLRQICDWAFFLDKNSGKIDWDKVKQMSVEAGFFSFLCCLNFIAKEYFLPSLQIPNWYVSKKLKERVLDDILNNKRDQSESKILKFINFFRNSWKHRLVHNEGILPTLFRRLRPFIIINYQKDKKMVWR